MAPKIRDREMRGIQSSKDWSNRVNKDKTDRVKRAKNIVEDLKRHGPAGLLHVIVLSNIIERPIQIWNADGSLNKIIGKEKTGRPIDIEYHASDSGLIGHWTLKYGKDPDDISIDLNSCMFSVIGSQIGQNPSELRRRTFLKLKSNLWKLANRIDEILRLKKNGKAFLMIGGARYIGTSPSDAKAILDNSQDRLCHECKYPGHPRGHARHPSEPNVQSYSRNSMKTAFLSREDQDYVTHLALRTRTANEAMTRLNRGDISIKVTVEPNELKNNLRNNFPKAQGYCNQVPVTEERDIQSVVFILRHHRNEYRNPEADVFVHTCYPTISNFM